MPDNELEHIGVLGMKWGHRKGGSSSGSRKPASHRQMSDEALKAFVKDPKRQNTKYGKQILKSLKKDAYPKDWSTKKKWAVGIGLALPALVAPLYLAVPYVVGLRIYANSKYKTQRRAKDALIKIGKQKVSSLPKPKFVDSQSEGD